MVIHILYLEVGNPLYLPSYLKYQKDDMIEILKIILFFTDFARIGASDAMIRKGDVVI